MRKILSVFFSFFVFSSPFCHSSKQNTQQSSSKVSNSKGNLFSFLANYFLFFGTKDDVSHLKNLSKKFEIKELNIDWDSLKIHGYTLQPRDKKYNTVCICFGSDFYPCHKMITSYIDDSILYVCIDYPGFGKSEQTKMNQCKLTDFADMVYSYVSENYKNYNLIAFGFSLGGFPASLMCYKEKIKKVVLISPVYLTGMLSKLFSESTSKYLVDFLWGYELNSLKNIFECKRNCDISMYSGDEWDFLSLYYTLPFYFRSRLENKKNNKQKLEKIKSMIKNYKHLNIDIYVYDDCSHMKIHPKVIKENKNLFSIDTKNLV